MYNNLKFYLDNLDKKEFEETLIKFLNHPIYYLNILGISCFTKFYLYDTVQRWYLIDSKKFYLLYGNDNKYYIGKLVVREGYSDADPAGCYWKDQDDNEILARIVSVSELPKGVFLE